MHISQETTVGQAIYDNQALRGENFAETAWLDIVSVIGGAHRCTARMERLNLSFDGVAFCADFIVELSDSNLVKTHLKYSTQEQTLGVVSTLDIALDSSGVCSQDTRTLEQGQARSYSAAYTLQDVSEGILTSAVAMAYESLRRANNRLYPMQPSQEMLRKLEQAI